MKNHRKNSHKINSSRMLLVPLLLILLAGTILTVLQTQKQQQTKTLATVQNDCTVAPEQMIMSETEKSLFDQINQYRQQNNLSPLENSLTLKRASAWMSKDMQKRSVLNRIDSLGRDTPTRLSDCGLPFPSIIGEIIDIGDATSVDLITAWKHSPPQSGRLLNKNFTHIGVAAAYGSTPVETYWTVTFSGPDLIVTMPPYYPPYPTLATTLTPSGTQNPNPNPNPNPTSGNNPGNSLTPTVKPTVKPTTKPAPTLTPTPTPKSSNNPNVTPTPTSTINKIPVPSKASTITSTPTPFPTIDPKFVQNADDTQIYVTVKVPSIGADGNRTPKHQSRRIQATIYDTKNEEIKVGTADLRFNGDVFQGNMHMGKIDNGIYAIKISGIRTLKNVIEPQFQTLSNQRLNVMPQVVLRQGDVSEDNALTLEDYNLVLECFQDKKCKRDGTEFIDFNDSGTADVVDYNILLQSFYRLAGD